MWLFQDSGPSLQPSLLQPSLCHGQVSGPDGSVLGPLQVLFCYEQFDELTLLHLREFDKKKLISVETDIVVDHYKEEKFEDRSPGQFFPFWAQMCGWWPGGAGEAWTGPGTDTAGPLPSRSVGL